MMKKRQELSRFALGLILAAVIFIVQCDFMKVTDPESASLFKSSYYGMSLHDAMGKVKTDFYSYETLFFKAEAVEMRRQCDIQVVRLSDKRIIRRAIVLSDPDGKIASMPLWYDIGTDEQGRDSDVSGDYVVHFLRSKPYLNVTIPFTVKRDPDPTAPQVRGVRQDGAFHGGSVLIGEAVWAKGSGFAPGTEVRLYIVADKRSYAAGDALVDESGGFETVIAGADGTLPITLIWGAAAAFPGAGFDIVADVAPFGAYNEGDAIASALLTGFVVQEPATGADIITQLACDSSGRYKDVFEPTDAISVRSLPERRPLRPGNDAAVYIVSHQDIWTEGDILVAMPFETTHEMPFYLMDRFLSGSLHLFPVVPDTTPKHRINLVPGKYDVVIDIGRDGVYNKGTDLLDGGSQVGFTVPGVPPDVVLTVGMNSDFLLPDEIGIIHVKLIRGADCSPIAEAPVTLEITYGPGSLSVTNTITNVKGLARSEFSGAGMGDVTGIKVTAVVDGKSYSTTYSIWVKVVYPHDQGGIGGR